ncbi:hypothetical protein L7F22_030973 [Adiantum nelumboides]|nr:hypothetical protein [Adiantum nelumboides]
MQHVQTNTLPPRSSSLFTADQHLVKHGGPSGVSAAACAPSVAFALASRRPVVALESTIITHGLPYPANLQTALAIEQAVRDQGAVPATTAFLDGTAHVGLDKAQLERLAEVGPQATKTSRRDVSSVLAAGRGSVGATTVSGTMILAHLAGIAVFGTVALVVPVVDSLRDAARLIHANMQFDMQTGMVFGVPIPPEFEGAGERIQAIVEQAVQESKELGVDRRGKEVTPWLLKRVGELSEGESVTSNKALVINNVATAAKVARELEDLRAIDAQALADRKVTTYYGNGFEAIDEDTKSGELAVVGFAAVDITTQPTQAGGIGAATTWPGRNTLSLGGVARNMAESAHRMLAGRAGPVKLISPVGNDVLGDFVRAGLTGLGMSTDGLVLSSGRTASVMLQLDASGDLLTGIADIDESQLKPDDVRRDADRRPARVVAFDGNISVATMDTLLSDMGNVTVFEPTSVARCVKIIKARSAPDIMTPNEFEVVACTATQSK